MSDLASARGQVKSARRFERAAADIWASAALDDAWAAQAGIDASVRASRRWLQHENARAAVKRARMAWARAAMCFLRWLLS